MESLYWGCLWGGLIFAIITIIFGDLLGDICGGIFHSLSFDHLDFLSPVVLVSGITIFGGAGIMLGRISSLAAASVAVFSVIIALIFSILIYFVNVRPMKNAENSSGYSMAELVGKIGTVSVPVPGNGFGEILVKIGGGNTNHIACSCNGEDFPMGTRVVVAEVENGVLKVFLYEEQ